MRWSVSLLGTIGFLVLPSLAEATLLETSHIVAREDDPTPSGDGSLWFPESRFVLNDAGQVTWVSRLKDASGGEETKALLFWDADSLIEVIRTGDPLPGGSPAFGGVLDLALNDSGSILIDGGHYLFVSNGSTIEVVNDPNGPAPNGDGSCCDRSITPGTT